MGTFLLSCGTCWGQINYSPSDAKASAAPICARNLFQVSHWVQGPKALGHPQLLSRPQAEVGWEMELPGVESVPIWDPGAFKPRILAARPLCLAQIYVYFYGKAEGKREEGTGTKIFYPLNHSPSGCKSWSRADLKPGSQSLFSESHVSEEVPNLTRPQGKS